MLHRRYGPNLVFVNLLSTTRENERRLTSCLEEQLQLYEQDHCSAIPPLHIRYDFHLQASQRGGVSVSLHLSPPHMGRHTDASLYCCVSSFF